jgi:hypothetical protein
LQWFTAARIPVFERRMPHSAAREDEDIHRSSPFGGGRLPKSPNCHRYSEVGALGSAIDVDMNIDRLHDLTVGHADQ